MACYANTELYGIMSAVSAVMAGCKEDPGFYPNNKPAGAGFCLFSQMQFVSKIILTKYDIVQTTQ